MARRILVTGASGYVGGRITARARAAGRSVVGTYFAQASEGAGARLDVRDANAVRALPDPVNRYGAAKAAAETAVRAIAPDAAVVRTSLVLGDGDGRHEVPTRALVTGRATGALFTDEIRKPVHVDDLADALLELATNGYRGVLDVAGADAISRYDLGVLVAARDGLDPRDVPAAPTADAGARRPADVRLCVDRARAVLSTRLRGAREFVAAR